MAFKGDLRALILGVLQVGDLHGYEISRRIKNVSSDALQIWEGQLYPALHQLENDGCVVATWINQEGKPARKMYSITEQGLRELDQHLNSWKQFRAGIEAVIAPVKPKESAQ